MKISMSTSAIALILIISSLPIGIRSRQQNAWLYPLKNRLISSSNLTSLSSSHGWLNHIKEGSLVPSPERRFFFTEEEDNDEHLGEGSDEHLLREHHAYNKRQEPKEISLVYPVLVSLVLIGALFVPFVSLFFFLAVQAFNCQQQQSAGFAQLTPLYGRRRRRKRSPQAQEDWPWTGGAYSNYTTAATTLGRHDRQQQVSLGRQQQDELEATARERPRDSITSRNKEKEEEEEDQQQQQHLAMPPLPFDTLEVVALALEDSFSQHHFGSDLRHLADLDVYRQLRKQLASSARRLLEAWTRLGPTTKTTT